MPPNREEPLEVLEPEVRGMDGIALRRVLPAPSRQMMGPFMLLDHLGPGRLPPGEGIDVRPHPHIHLVTITYLFAGDIVHRDHLGACATIRPGDLGWMTAGRGIVHSERSGDESRGEDSPVHGIQLWVGLPRADEDVDPEYLTYLAESLPQREDAGVRLRVLIGELEGLRSPVKTFSPMLLAELRVGSGTAVTLPSSHSELGAYVLAGSISVDGRLIDRGQFVVLPDRDLRLESENGAHAIVLGGEPLDGERHRWWNFVSSSPERITQAAADWRDGRFPQMVGDSTFIPLPDEGPPRS